MVDMRPILTGISVLRRHYSTYESRRVVVTGLGSLTSLGTDTNTTWQALLDNKSGIRAITEGMNDDDEKFGEIYKKLASQVAGRVDRQAYELKRNALIQKSDLRAMSRTMAFSLVASNEALKDAGLLESDLRRQAGVAIGSSLPDFTYIGDAEMGIKNPNSKAKLSPYFVPKVLPNLNGGHVSLVYSLTGPLHCVSTACASGTHAIGDAFNFIKTGAANVMVAGGGDCCISPLTVAGFCKARALATKFNHQPEVASRPFDKSRDGFSIGEGCGILILEELEFALERGANIYAEVVGYGLSGDAFHITSGRDDGEGAHNAMLGAARYLSHWNEDFELWGINAHATSTPKGDKAELLAIKKFLQSSRFPQNLYAGDRVFVTSHKGNFGHLLAGAGAAESCFVCLALKHGRVPATINIDELDDLEMDPRVEILTENAAVENSGKKRKVIVKNSFGFGGTNATLMFADFSS